MRMKPTVLSLSSGHLALKVSCVGTAGLGGNSRANLHDQYHDHHHDNDGSGEPPTRAVNGLRSMDQCGCSLVPCAEWTRGPDGGRKLR